MTTLHVHRAAEHMLWAVAALLALVAGCGSPPPSPEASAPARPAGQAPALVLGEQPTVTGGEPFHGLLPYRAKDAKLALIRPSFVTAADAHLPDGVSVVGVSVDGVDRAYPLYVMKNHQVVNDRLGEVPVAASW